MQKNRDRITAAGSLFFYVLHVHVFCFLDSCLDADSFLVHPVITDLFRLAQQMFLAGENQSGALHLDHQGHFGGADEKRGTVTVDEQVISDLTRGSSSRCGSRSRTG